METTFAQVTEEVTDVVSRSEEIRNDEQRDRCPFGNGLPVSGDPAGEQEHA